MMAGSPIIATMRYRDANRAVDWLCRAFGFERHQVFTNDEGRVVHAELRFGDGIIMLGPVADTEFGRHMVQPGDIGGKITQSIYVVVPDADAHYAKAKEAGAEILLELKDEDY